MISVKGGVVSLKVLARPGMRMLAVPCPSLCDLGRVIWLLKHSVWVSVNEGMAVFTWGADRQVKSDNDDNNSYHLLEVCCATLVAVVSNHGIWHIIRVHKG